MVCLTLTQHQSSWLAAIVEMYAQKRVIADRQQRKYAVTRFAWKHTTRMFVTSMSESSILTDLQGLFTFEYNVVNECNKVSCLSRFVGLVGLTVHQLCNCAADCGNKVAQQPRNVHLELFRCRGKGWGVRSLEDLPVGKVLGLYTG